MAQRKVMSGLLPRIAVGVFGLLTVAMVLLAIFDDRGALEVHKRREVLNKVTDELNVLQQQNEALKKEITGLRSDPATIERIAREQLKLVKPGEIVLITPETPPK